MKGREEAAPKETGQKEPEEGTTDILTDIVEEIEVEDLAVDGICGVY